MDIFVSKSSPIIVIGAGAAGIIAAVTAAKLGRRVILLEKTDRIGTKILISGGGKCNITHDGPVESVLRDFRPNEARFLRPSFYRYFNEDILEIFHENGLETYVRPNGRVFPVNQTAKDVCRILHQVLIEASVEIRFDTRVQDIRKTENGYKIITEKGHYESPQVILAVGGSSFPKTGTTGDGFPWAEKLGHKLVPIIAALAPIEMDLFAGLPKAGVPLRDIVLKARYKGKEIARWRDDLLFTHRGISGPTVLGIAREVAEQENPRDVLMEVDLAPNQSFEDVSKIANDWKSNYPNHRAWSIAETFLPKSLVDDFLASVNLEADDRAQQIDKKKLNRLVEAIKGWQIGTVKEVVLEKGEVVAGGVELSEVDPHTMESLINPGLFLCGEILDIAGDVGGYNLQAAWSTGFVAGESAANSVTGD